MTKEEILKIPISINEATSRFEFALSDGLGFVEYEKRGSRFFLMHTEIPESFRGTGAASIMVSKIMDYLRENQFKMSPFCPIHYKLLVPPSCLSGFKIKH